MPAASSACRWPSKPLAHVDRDIPRQVASPQSLVPLLPLREFHRCEPNFTKHWCIELCLGKSTTLDRVAVTRRASSTTVGAKPILPSPNKGFAHGAHGHRFNRREPEKLGGESEQSTSSPPRLGTLDRPGETKSLPCEIAGEVLSNPNTGSIRP